MGKGKKLLEKVLYTLGFETEEEEQYSEEQEEIVEKKKPNVIGLPVTNQLKVLVLEPSMFEEVQKVSDHLKGRKQVIINLEHVERETAQRIVDFLSGATYSLNGSMQKLGNNIFLFTPSNVIIANESKAALNKVVNINWDKNNKGDLN